MKHQKILFLFILLFSLIFRLRLTPLTFHTDQVIQASWGQYLYFNPTNTLYTNQVWTFAWPNDPPLTILYYKNSYSIYRFLSLHFQQLNFFLINNLHFNYFNPFALSLDQIISPEIPLPFGYMLTMKIWPILADIIIAILIFKIVSSKTKWPIILPAVYLISPFSWYISSFWGQTNQINYLFTLLAFLFASKHLFLSILFFYFGAAIKPTSLILVPLYLFLIYRSKAKIVPFIFAILICLFLTYFTFSSVSSGPIISFTFDTLIPQVFNRPDRLTTNSYNFWHIFTLNNPVAPNLFAKISSYLLFIFINLFAFKFLKKITTKNVLSALFIVSFGSWLFLTNMLDRYSFASIVTGLILTIYYPKTFFYWLVLSLIYWLNLFRGWWYPVSFEFLKNIMVYKNYIFGYLPSILNTIIFLIFTKKLRSL